MRTFALTILILSIPVLAQAQEDVPKPAAGAAGQIQKVVESIRAAAGGAPGKTETKPGEDGAVDLPRTAPPPLAPKFIRLHLGDGSILAGELSVPAITVETSFGKLVTPIEKIVSFTPGLDSKPALARQIAGLIDLLGNDDYKTREQAQRDLVGYGVKVQRELEQRLNSENAEIKRRVGEILKELEEQADNSDDESTPADAPWIRLDTLVTTEFTMVGKISPAEFTLSSKYGPLSVQLEDIRRAEREQGGQAPFRKSLSLGGESLAQRSFKSSGIRVQPGDKITITADGNLTMTPWGGNSMSGPEGGQNFGWYLPNQIPGGALIAKLGDKGQVFKVGRKITFVAKTSGVLQFAIGMQAEYANEGYQFPGEYQLKIKVEPK